jgi:hypothetical protein
MHTWNKNPALSRNHDLLTYRPTYLSNFLPTYVLLFLPRRLLYLLSHFLLSRYPPYLPSHDFYLPACSAIFRHYLSGVRGRVAAVGIATAGAMMASGVSEMDETSVRLDGSRDGFSICDKSEVLIWRTYSGTHCETRKNGKKILPTPQT